LQLRREKWLKHQFRLIDRYAGAVIRYGDFGEVIDARCIDCRVAPKVD
jgi:hypothetical protein